MSEFDNLIGTICNPVSSVESRSAAERRLLDLLSDINTWSQHLSILFTANDMICFFIGIGYQRLIWRHWSHLAQESRDALTTTVTSVLMTRNNMAAYAKAKLEQVLAAICVNSQTLQPVLNLIVDCNQPGAYNGLSAMRTVMDCILSEDPKIDPNTRQSLEALTANVIHPLTNLACTACMNALQSYNEENSGLMLVALELMKTVVAKLPIGPHISADVLNLMFTIAELGADHQSVFHQSALSSMEILTEIMLKKYIPRDNSGADAQGKTQDRTVHMMMHIVNKTVMLLKSYREHGNIDDSAIVLTLLDFISVFSESHLDRCLQHSQSISAEESASLSQNISSFFAELVAITTVSMDPKVLVKIVSVWNRIITIEAVKELIVSQNNVCTPIIAHLLQAALLQSNKNLQENLDELIEDLKLDIVVDPHIKEILSKVSSISSSYPFSPPAVSQPSSSSSAGDKEHHHHHRKDDVLGAEEFNYVGSALLTDIADLFAVLVDCPAARSWLQSTVNGLLGQNISAISASFAATAGSSSSSVSSPKTPNGSRSHMKHLTLDLCFLIRLLPMVSDNKAELVLQVAGFLMQIIEHNKVRYQLFSKRLSKEMIVLPLNCCQIAGQILQSCLNGISFPATQPQENLPALEWSKILEPLVTLLARGMLEYVNCHSTASSSGSTAAPIDPSHEIVFQGVAILLTQTLQLYSELFEEKSLAAYSTRLLKTQLEEMFQNILAHPQSASLEIYALIVCSQDSLNPQSVAPLLVGQLLEASRLLQNSLATNNFEDLGPLLDIVTRLSGSMDVLTRNHSVSKAPRRQTLIQHFLPLTSSVVELHTLLLQIGLQAWKFALVTRYAIAGCPLSFSASWPVETAQRSVRLSLALTCALLQCLGKKTFSKPAADVFEVSVAFIETCTASQGEAVKELPAVSAHQLAGNASLQRIFAVNPHNALPLALFDGQGIRFLLQALELCRVLAESTAASSQSVGSQIQSTYRLVQCVLPFLSDERVCAELLQATLKAGITAVRCYWQKGQRFPAAASPFSAGGQPHPLSQLLTQQTQPADEASNGLNVRPLVELLVQLCVGSLGQNIPPQDTQLALEGMLTLRSQHNLFRVAWFQDGLWLGLFLPVLRAIVLRMHDSNYHQLEELFVELCDAKLEHLAKTSQAATSASSPVKPSASVALQEFWIFVGQEMVKIAGEYDCSTRVHEIIAQSLAAHSWTSHDDCATCLRLLIFPVAAEISRRT